MNDQAHDTAALARRALEAARKCGLDWLPGMHAHLYQGGRRHGRCRVERIDSEHGPIANGSPMDTEGTLPDLSDTLTALGVEEWARMAWGAQVSVREWGGEWVAERLIRTSPNQSGWGECGRAPTRVEAAVLALEAAAERRDD